VSLAVAGVVSGIVWLALLAYRERGRAQLRLLFAGEVSEPSGLGAWYARNITSNLLSVPYGIAQFSLLPIVFWVVVAVIEPSHLAAVFSSTAFTFPLFILGGFVYGYRQILSVLDPDNLFMRLIDPRCFLPEFTDPDRDLKILGHHLFWYPENTPHHCFFWGSWF
jgi:hypothetical protein